MSCSRTWEVYAIDEGRLGASDADAFDRHALMCAICARERAALEELRVLARQLPAREPGELEARRLRARVLRDAMTASSRAPRRRRLGLAGLAVAASAAAAVVVATKPARPVATRASFAAVVTPAPAAAWTQARDGQTERVVLGDGELALQVRKQAPDERFVVVVPDGEVEVRGTTFDVEVRNGHTERVHVDDGVVVVRVHGESVLQAGDTWTPVPAPVPGPASARTSPPAPVAASVSPPTALSPPLPPRVARRAQPAPPPGRERAADNDAEMTEYERAVDAYRLGRFEEASELLHAFAAAHPASALLEDATFLEASSAASAGHADAAAGLAERHLARYPGSFHAKDAAILVARSRRDHADCAGARKALAPWLGGPRPDPAATATLGGCASTP